MRVLVVTLVAGAAADSLRDLRDVLAPFRREAGPQELAAVEVVVGSRRVRMPGRVVVSDQLVARLGEWGDVELADG